MRISAIFIFLFLSFSIYGQTRKTSDWINFGSNHVSKWIQVAPGKMGPNALPVPEMDYAQVANRSGFEAGTHFNVMKGDTSISSFLAFDWAVVPEKVAVKIWGFPTETFRTNNEVRDDRQIYYDDTGWMTGGGDIWISTFIQIIKDRNKWPDVVLNYSLKTTTGSILHARYTDAPVHYFYAAFGKSFFPENHFLSEVRVAGMGGFYIWQTNKVEMAQDEGPLFEAGVKIRHKTISLMNEVGGYWGYGAYDFLGVKSFAAPIVYRAKLLKEGERFDWKLEYRTGWKDYKYTTFIFGVAYRFNVN